MLVSMGGWNVKLLVVVIPNYKKQKCNVNSNFREVQFLLMNMDSDVLRDVKLFLISHNLILIHCSRKITTGCHNL